MKKSVKVFLEYYGQWSGTTTQDYKIVKIIGAPLIVVEKRDRTGVTNARIGDLVTEDQAVTMAADYEVTTTAKRG